eukprot:4371241-Karenia_brevis.AAC.1
MSEKHPDARPSEQARSSALRTVHGSALTEISIEEVDKAIKSFPRGSAGGCTGWRPQYFKDALHP